MTSASALRLGNHTMSTTLSSSAAASGVITHPAPDGMTRRINTSNRRSSLRLVALSLVVPVLAIVLWNVANWSRDAVAVGRVDKFVVGPRDFSVVLKEKGELKAAKSTEIVSEVEGRATIITLVPEGSFVQQGDLLVELASNEIEDRIRQEELKEANAITAFEASKTELDIQRDQNASDIRKAELQIELARLEFDKYQKGDWVQQLKDSGIAIDQAQINLERRTEDFEASKKLLERDFITRTEYKEDEFNHQKAVWELEKATKAKEVLEQYTHVAAQRQRESDLQEAIKEAERVRKNADAEEAKKVGALEGRTKELALTQDQLAKLRRQKDKCVIKAPTQGFVVYYAGGGGRWMSDDNQIREGATVFERQVMLTLPDTSEMTVLVRVHEAKTDKLQLGQRATVTVEGLPGRTFAGEVTKIAVVADSQNRWLNPDLKEYETEIRLDEGDPALKPGVTAYAEILVQTVEDKLAVPVQAVYTKTGQRYVFQDNGSQIKPMPIQLGAVGAEWAEVANGLSGGESILLAFGDDHKRMIPDAPSDRRGMMMNGRGPGTAAPPAGETRTGERRMGPPAQTQRPKPSESADRSPARKPDRGAAQGSRGTRSTSP